MRGGLFAEGVAPDAALEAVRAEAPMQGLDLAREVTPHVTFLGAHVVPPEFATERTAHVELVSGPMLAAVMALPEASRPAWDAPSHWMG